MNFTYWKDANAMLACMNYNTIFVKITISHILGLFGFIECTRISNGLNYELEAYKSTKNPIYELQLNGHFFQ